MNELDKEFAVFRDKFDELFTINDNGVGDKILRETLMDCRFLGKSRLSTTLILIDTLVCYINKEKTNG